MHFHFNTFNHCPQGQIIVEDITRIMGGQLMALGHAVDWTIRPMFYPRARGYNVILESFADDPNTMIAIRGAYGNGCRFIYVATEEPTMFGFNHGLEPAMIDRQDAFPEAAKYADGILHLIPGEPTTTWYGQFAPAAYAELGYAETIVYVEPSGRDVEPTHDFGFYGKMTWRREHMLARLEKMTGKEVLRITSLDVPWPERDRRMRRAKVIVQIRANEEWGMVSSTRCASALGFGRPIVAEPHPNAAPWDEIVHFSPSIEAFYYDAMQATRTWKDLHAAQLNKFMERLSPEVCIGEPLRKIGILP